VEISCIKRKEIRSNVITRNSEMECKNMEKEDWNYRSLWSTGMEKPMKMGNP
jgi:hypothetical protein